MRRGDITRLVQPDRVHRDLYISDELFRLEQQHFFANTWNYIGHASQVPDAGDYLTVDIAGRPLVMVRQTDGSIRVLNN
ncbi:MAG TPA: Rieske 2Fe-2S domain-containing protein, partial [Burkholderiaceae bacterium]|nr:Rieske 2Fe-2S domain-containing protein [Burkholderiaceae bacterium]